MGIASINGLELDVRVQINLSSSHRRLSLIIKLCFGSAVPQRSLKERDRKNAKTWLCLPMHARYSINGIDRDRLAIRRYGIWAGMTMVCSYHSSVSRVRQWVSWYG